MAYILVVDIYCTNKLRTRKVLNKYFESSPFLFRLTSHVTCIVSAVKAVALTSLGLPVGAEGTKITGQFRAVFSVKLKL